MRSRWFVASACVALLGAAACTDEGEADTMNNVGGESPSTGGAGANGSDGGGGAGGVGGAGGGTGGEGGEGGGVVECLAPTVADGFFTFAGGGLCVTEVWTAENLELAGYGTTPTWGSHGGPLTFHPTKTGVTIERWSKGNGGALEVTSEDVTVADVPPDAFWGPLAVEHATPAGDDCAASTGIALAWTGSDYFNEGAIVRVVDGAASSQLAAGVFGMTAIGPELYYSGLSNVGGPTDGMLGLYGAEANATCEDPGYAGAGSLDAWGLATGPAAADASGNLFAIMTDYETGTQELRGYFGADTSDPGAPLATLDGYGDALAVVAPIAGVPGMIVLQPNLADDTHGDVVFVAYSVEAGDILAEAPQPLLDVTQADDNVVVLTDADNRLWVGLTRTNGTPTSTFFVLEPAPLK